MKTSLSAYNILLGVLFLFTPYFSISQEDSKTVDFESNLLSVIQLNIEPDVRLEFGMKEINERLFQVTRYPDDVIFSVESTEDWTLSIAATSSYFRGVQDSTLTIPVDFVGLMVESHGNNYDNGKFSNIYNTTKDTIIELSSEKTMLLTNGRRHNIGNAQDNYFVLRWIFLYQDDPKKMGEFYNFKMANDLFRVGVRLTLTKSIDPTQSEPLNVIK